MSDFSYIGNAGQTYMPFQKNTAVKTLPYTPLDRPEPPLPALELNAAAREKGIGPCAWAYVCENGPVVPGGEGLV